MTHLLGSSSSTRVNDIGHGVSRSMDLTHNKKGDKVMLSMFHHHHDYLQKDNGCVAKFMPHYDGPYTVTHPFPKKSVYTLNMPNSPELHATFHTTLLSKYMENNPDLFLGCVRQHLGTIVMEDGEVKWWVDQIVDEWKHRLGYQYLVRWSGKGPNMTCGC